MCACKEFLRVEWYDPRGGVKSIKWLQNPSSTVMGSTCGWWYMQIRSVDTANLNFTTVKDILFLLHFYCCTFTMWNT